MKAIILQGSPRREGNTATLTRAFEDRMKELGWETESLWLRDYKIEPCLGCYNCQNVDGFYGCVQKDDGELIWNRVLQSDLLVLSTPIYVWYCTAQMKNFLDRHYGVNKYYGSAAAKGEHNLTKDLSVALITTHGYKADYANEPFETGMKRFCKHSNWKYLGLYSERDFGDDVDFSCEEFSARARSFADLVHRKWAENHT